MIKPKYITDIVTHDSDNDLDVDRQEEGKLVLGTD